MGFCYNLPMAKSGKNYKLAKTFTARYSQREDRLRLTINYQEPMERLDFWITRNMLLRLLPIMSRFGARENEATLESSQNYEEGADAPSKELDREELYKNLSAKTDEEMYALTEKKPVLLEKVSFLKSKDGVEILFSGEGEECLAKLTNEEVDVLAKHLIKSAPTYDWGIGPWW